MTGSLVARGSYNTKEDQDSLGRMCMIFPIIRRLSPLEPKRKCSVDAMTDAPRIPLPNQRVACEYYLVDSMCERVGHEVSD